MTISHAQGIIDNFALIHHLTPEFETLSDEDGEYLSVDLTDEEGSYVSFDLYVDRNFAARVDSDSADLKTLVQDHLFPILP